GNGKGLPSLPFIHPNQLPPPESDELNLRQILTAIRRRGVVIAGVAIAVTYGVYFWTSRQTPKFESNFKLLVESVTEENNLDKLTQIPGAKDIPNSNLDYETQLQVLRSPNLMAPIVKEINKYYPDVTYESLFGNNKLIVSRLGTTKIIEGRYRDTDRTKVRRILHEVARGYLRYSLTERQMNLKQGIGFVEGQLPLLRDRVDKLQGQLQSFRQQNNLLDPEIQSQQLSTRVSSIAQEALETEVKLQETRTLYTALTKQLELSPQEAVATVTITEAPRYQQLLNKLAEIESQIAIESARFTSENPEIKRLKEQQQNLLPLLEAEAKTVLGKNLPEAGVENDSPSSIRTSLTQKLVEATNQLQVLQVRKESIAQAQKLVDFQVKQMPVIARRYTDLQRELQVATDSLNRFMAVRESLEIEIAQKALPWQIILKPQEPKNPVWPNEKRNITLGAIAGLLLGIGLALLIERLDNRFHSPDELKDLTKLPLLGVIPYQRNLKKLMAATQQVERMSAAENISTQDINFPHLKSYTSSPFLESFRSLHTNIRFLGTDTPIHSMVISSATSGDGKSTTALHLAQAAAAMGRQVLLVDADLRRPQVHVNLGLENEVGLSNLIATKLTPKEAIQRLPAWNHLYVLTAGQLPPDPTRLLSSHKMQHLMQQLHAVFDLVIYDTPPLLGLADGRILAAHTDGVILVAGLAKTDRFALMQTLDSVKISSATILGIIANGVKGYTTSSYYYYHKYYSGGSESDILRANKLLLQRMTGKTSAGEKSHNSETF
ncbi:MAG TPA: protein tyrosine kinase, partial [Cyanobacteria bacterium UBA11166]|nr:protein tyrosine kinase [Cyanobacteria bacterium UBA11166]